MDTREQKGLEIAARMRVVRDGDAWSVPSQTTGGKYHVDPAAPSCTCEDFGLRGPLPCKHVFAVRFVLDRESGATVPTLPVPADNDDMPPPARPTYRQNWPAYLKAQLSEKHRFRVLLADLCRGVPEPPRVKIGRKPVPLADAVFACCFKVYATVSARRFNCDLEDARAAGHLSRPLHPHKISALMETPGLTPILRGLIAESAAPLAAVEVDFAADSTAFSTSRFVRWFDQKYGRVREEHHWVKLQAMCGVRTNVITSAAVVTDGPDGPHLPGLVKETAERCTVREVSADKGYSSIAAHEAVDAAGGTPFIAFKRIATGGSGGLWGRMFHYFSYNREEFLTHYHKRSNIEATFSAVKRKFGDALRSKTDAALTNEVLCKVLCHNIVTLIHEQEELGLVPEFWGDTEAEVDEPRSVIRFPGA